MQHQHIQQMQVFDQVIKENKARVSQSRLSMPSKEK